jgi:putative ABC transport system permease protein
MENLMKDLKYGLRMIVSHPGFTAVAVASLALGIGLNTTIFSIVNAVLLRPPAVRDPGELVQIYSHHPDFQYGSHSYPDYIDYKRENTVFQDLAGHSLMIASHNQEDQSSLVIGEVVTTNYFDLLGVKPLIGRGFGADDDPGQGGSPVVVLGHGFWQRHFGGKGEALGQSVRLNGIHYTVIGVLPPKFTGMIPGFPPELWVPVTMVDEVEPAGIQDTEGTITGDTKLEQRGRRWMFIKGRLKEGVTFDEARAQMSTIATRLEQEYQDSNRNYGASLVPANEIRFHPALDRVLSPVAAVLLGVVGIVLLIACANVANMLLAKATTRQQEIAVRLAIGASRSRLVRQLLAESLLLAGIGGALGLLIALWTTRLAQAYRPNIPFTFSLDLGIDTRVLIFTLCISILTGVLFGLAPAFRASRTDLVTSLKEYSHDRRGGGRSRLSSLLVVGQVALSMVLLVGAGLLVRSLISARSIDTGFDHKKIGLITLGLSMNQYSEDQSRQFYQQLSERVRSLPGVESTTDVTRVPLSMDININEVFVDGHELTPDDDSPFLADVTFIGKDYFSTMGVPLLQGREIGDVDAADSSPVVIVNEAFARSFWPNESALGKRIRHGSLDGTTYEIVGVSRNYNVRAVGEKPRPYIHFARAQRFNDYGSVVYRSTTDPTTLLETVRREALAIDPDVVVMETTTMAERTTLSLFPVRAGSALLAGFSALAVLLASVGLYGLVAYWVGQRTREIGIRMAMGAETSRIAKLVLKQGMVLAAVGIVLGLAAGLALSRVLASVLYEISPWDPVTFIGSALLLLAVAFLANAIPARRAANVDPMVALRYE